MQISLRAARVNAEMKQTDVAKVIGVDKTTIINWEAGKTSPKAEQLQKLCSLYRIPMDNIFLRTKST